MKGSLTFKRGGVHPDDSKSLTSGLPIIRMPMPAELVIPLSEHIGAPAQPTVVVGDSVRRGQKIAGAQGYISANIHTPATGRVVDIRKVRLCNGVETDAVVVACDAEQPEVLTECEDWRTRTAEDLVGKIRDMGVVGAGGAMFPADVKFTVAPDRKVDALLINGSECEPFLTSDHRLMLEHAEELLEGIQILRHILSPARTVIGIEENKADAIELLKAKVHEAGLSIEVQSLKMKYPEGDEKMLINAILGREVPQGKLPIDAGAIVSNISTVYAVRQACVLQQPFMERVVTVTGECIAAPANVLAPIGTKVSDIIAFCGGYSSTPGRLVSGGPMMGFEMVEDVPLTKGMGGILALPPRKPVAITPCISCGRCVDVCPIGLSPTLMFKYIGIGDIKAALDLNLMDCKECGSCSYVCPAHIPLVDGFKYGKKMRRTVAQ